MRTTASLGEGPGRRYWVAIASPASIARCFCSVNPSGSDRKMISAMPASKTIERNLLFEKSTWSNTIDRLGALDHCAVAFCWQVVLLLQGAFAGELCDGACPRSPHLLQAPRGARPTGPAPRLFWRDAVSIPISCSKRVGGALPLTVPGQWSTLSH